MAQRRKRKRWTRMSPREAKAMKRELKRYLESGVEYTNEELAEIFHLSKRQLIRIKNEVKFGVRPKVHPLVAPRAAAGQRVDDPTLDLARTVKIDKTLDPIQFCDQYLVAKPNIAQRVILKTFYGLEFTPAESVVMQEWVKKGWTTWNGPGKKYKELVVIAGMKGGKTTLASFMAQIEEYSLFKLGNPATHYGFTPGKEIYIINVATDKDQARETVFADIQASVQRSPYYKSRTPNEIGSTIELNDTNVRIKSGHSNSASLVGKTCKFVALDELDRFKTSGGKYSADEVYKALNRSVDPFGDEGHIASISSLVKDTGKMVELFLKCRTIPTMVGFWLPEWEMRRENYAMFKPGAGPETWFEFNTIRLPIEHRYEFEKDPEGFLRDKACVMGFAKGKFFRMPHKIDECLEQASNEGYRNGVNEDGTFLSSFKPIPEKRYYMHGDPSLNHDAYWIGMGHRDGNNFVIDFLHQMKPSQQLGEVDVKAVREFILSIYELGFDIDMMTYDVWAIADVVQELKKRGKKTDVLFIKKAQYDVLKDLIYQNAVKCPPVKKLVDELKSLELEDDRVDHPMDGSKDCADVAAGIVWNCMRFESSTSAAVVTSSDLREEDDPGLTSGFKSLGSNRRRIWDSGNRLSTSSPRARLGLLSRNR